MATGITTVSQISTDIAAHKRLMYYALRPQLFFDPVADVDSTNATSIGASVTFYFQADMLPATTALTENADVAPTQLADSTMTLTLSEYGNVAQTTALARATSFLDIMTALANVIGYNAGISVDTLAANALAAATNIAYSSNATTAGSFVTTGTEAADNRLVATDTFSGNMVRFAAAKLRAANVMPFADGLYRGFIHPDVAYDFKGTTGGTNWSDPHIYSSPEGIWNGTIGAFQGVRWMETPRAPLTADAGNGAGAAGTVDMYKSFVLGQQALAKAFSDSPEYGQQPVFVDTPVIDLLRRFRGAGWKHLVKYGIFRQASVWALDAASSIGANT
jgi:N4-gp56 family major capsid protein